MLLPGPAGGQLRAGLLRLGGLALPTLAGGLQLPLGLLQPAAQLLLPPAKGLDLLVGPVQLLLKALLRLTELPGLLLQKSEHVLFIEAAYGGGTEGMIHVQHLINTALRPFFLSLPEVFYHRFPQITITYPIFH